MRGNTIVPVLPGLTIDARISRGEGSDRRYFITDHLGSTRALTGPTGGVVGSYDYDPYGSFPSDPLDADNPYQYTGRERDASGLYYYRPRYYHPGMARFISEDPMGLAAGSNMYAYVEVNPINYIDPLGLEKVNLFPDDGTVFRSGAAADPDVHGVRSVYAHMSPDVVFDQRTGQTKRLDADGLAQLLMQEGWQPGEPVDFKGCRAARGDNSIAEQFSKKHRSSTKGATEFMWFNSKGISGSWGKAPFFPQYKNRLMPGTTREFHVPPRPHLPPQGLPPRSKRSP